MDIDRIVAPIVGFTIFEIPLIILLWLLIKSALVKINRIRSISYSEHDNKKDVVKVIILSIIILILFVISIFPIVIAIAPGILPKGLILIFLFGLFIIYVPIYGCLMGLFRGLGDAVGAGGSAYNVIKQLQGYIYEALEINQEKKNNHTKK